MALWRIPIRGLTVNEPENLYGNVLVTLSGMLSKVWDVSQIPNLPASKITSGTLAAARIPSLDASKITSGMLDLARIPSIDASRVPNIDASKVTTGTFAAARIPSLDASKITTGTFAADRIPSLAASKIASGTLSADRIPNISAAKITSGTLAADRIPSLDAAKIASGTLAAARIPSLDASKITSGTLGTARVPSLDASKITSGTLPIARGGTGATTAAAALKNIMAGKTALYNNATGTTGTVTLSATAANYNHMRIYFKATNDNTQCGSVDVYSPNGKYVSLCLVTPVSSPQAGVWVKGAVVHVSGTSITRTVSGNGFAGVADDGNTNNNIYIYRVEAWNE